MNKLWILGMILCSVYSIQNRVSHLSQHHGLTEQCCHQQNGKQCGKVWKDCCRNGCETSWWGGEWCKNDAKITSPCSNSCSQMCKHQGGVVCSHGVVGSFECCRQQDCQGTISKECRAHTQLNLRNCIKDGKRDIIGNIFSS